MTATPLATRRGASRIVTALLAAVVLTVATVTAWRLTPTSGAAAGASGGHQHGSTAAADSARPVVLGAADQRRIGITFAAVSAGPVVKSVRVVGQLAYDETRVVVVSPRLDGWVERLHADFAGRMVGAGEPLATLHSPMLTAAAEELLLARRLEASVADGSPEAKENAARLLSSARQRLATWGFPPEFADGIEQSGTAPRTLVLRAPVGGVVLDKNLLPGQRVMAGDPLFRIADLSVVWLEGEVFEQDLGVTRVGQEVTAEFQALPGDSRVGRISYVYPTLDPETRTARIRVTLANPGHRLKPGMFATIRFSPRVTGTVLSVPRSAVLSTGARHLVFVKRADGRFTPTDVQLGAQTEDRLEILGGLALGDTIVQSATFLLDAESNLGTLLGGMGDMPGMDMTAPGAAQPAARDSHSGHGE